MSDRQFRRALEAVLRKISRARRHTIVQIGNTLFLPVPRYQVENIGLKAGDQVFSVERSSRGRRLLFDFEPEPLAVRVAFRGPTMLVFLADDRTISVRWDQFPRLRDATAKQRSKWTLGADGYGIHWREIDEDLRVGPLVELAEQTVP